MLQQNSRIFSEAALKALAVALGATPTPRRGLLAGTRVETAEGWRPVETLQPGDALRSPDGTPRMVARVDRAVLEGRAAQDCLRGAVLVPEGILGSAAPVVVLAEQHVILHAPRVRAALGAEFALVPGRLLRGLKGLVAPQVAGPLTIVTPVFADEEAVWLGPGLLAHCPAADPAGATGPARFPLLDGRAAEALLAILSKPAGPSAPSPFRGAKASLPRRVKPSGRGSGRRGQAAAG